MWYQSYWLVVTIVYCGCFPILFATCSSFTVPWRVFLDMGATSISFFMHLAVVAGREVQPSGFPWHPTVILDGSGMSFRVGSHISFPKTLRFPSVFLNKGNADWSACPKAGIGVISSISCDQFYLPRPLRPALILQSQSLLSVPTQSCKAWW